MIGIKTHPLLYNFRRFYVKKPRINLVEMKYLNVAEKNDAAKTIAGQLSNGTARRREGCSVYNKIYEFEANVKGTKAKMIMTSVSGHLLQLEFLSSYRNWQYVDPQSLFDAPIRKACNEQFAPIKKTLEREVRGCNGLIIWTDCDREGENIGFEIIDVCRAIKPNITIYRAIFSEITSASVKRALNNLVRPDKRQSDAVDVRTELDLRTGASITRFQTMRLQRMFPEKISDKLISYGSCQIPTLGFVAERYKEIEAFVSEPFWKIKVTHTIDDLTVEFNWARNRLFNKQECEDYFLLCIENPKATVESVTVKPKSKWRPTPMDTVELEKLGSRKLKLSAKEVMTIAEKLYTKGIISYPRTETNMFSKEIDLISLVQEQTGHGIWGTFAERVVEWGPNPRNGTKSDQAHPPIHPTKMVAHMEGNEGRVYELICRHFLACVSKDAVGSETVVNITIAGEKFSANGLVIFERNYLDVYIYDKWSAKQIHKYEQGQQFEPTEITMPEGRTTAPPLLTEADLIALMEKHGIGTDATHAEHINTIKERGYIGVVDNGGLVPGVIGMGLYEGYDAMDLALAKPLLRAEFEADLKKICLGEKDPKQVLLEQIVKYKEAYKQIMDKITAMDEKMSQRIQEAPVQSANNTDNSGFEVNARRYQDLFQCPKCLDAPLALQQKKDQSAYFIGCRNYPQCKHSIWLPTECKDLSVLNENCPKCGSENKLLKMRLTQPYHKVLFNSPTGWYKTCLRCDAEFRNTFYINVDSVKRTGSIVSNVTPINYGTTLTADAATRSGSRVSKTKKPSDKTNPKTSKNYGSSSKTVPSATSKLTKKKQKNENTTNIRSYVTACSTSVLQQSTEDIAREELQNVPLEEFFGSNDGFDDFMLSAESNIPKLPSSATSQFENILSDDLASAFDGDDDEFMASIQWGTTTRRNDGILATNPAATTSNPRISQFEESFTAVFQDDDFGDDYVWGSASKHTKVTQPANKKPRMQLQETARQGDYSWGSNRRETQFQEPVSVQCTGCHNPAKELMVRKEGPNKGRTFYNCSKNNPCKFFQWADEVEANTTAASTSNQSKQSCAPNRPGDSGNISKMTINCNCNQPANSLTVRKEGPNTGRGFYACPNRDRSCGFFQWVDEGENQDMAWGSGGSSSQTTTSSTSSTVAKARKCGLCRQEGHSRKKCNRKAEYDYQLL